MGGQTPAATLMLHLLGKCNLECRHCYMGGAPRRKEVLPSGWVLDAIATAPTIGIDQLYLTGGEPLLYPSFDEVLEAATGSNLKITVCTNGTLIGDKEVAALSASGCEVNVSIDGDATFHDDFRQRRGAFAKSVSSVRALCAAGVPVTIVHTTLQSNLAMLESVAAWALDVGATRFLVQPLLRLGRGEELDDRRLTIEQGNELVIHLTDLANRYRGTMKCTLISSNLHHLRAHPCGAYVCNGTGCHRGVEQEIKKVVVREDGWILPEVTNLDRRLAIGHVDDGPLESLIEPYFADRYWDFDSLCRATYAEVLPNWPSVLVPWDQILAERSRRWPGRVALGDGNVAECASCSPASAALESVPLEVQQRKALATHPS